MNIELVQRHFARIGASLQIDEVSDRQWRWRYRTAANHQDDMTGDGRGEPLVVWIRNK